MTTTAEQEAVAMPDDTAPHPNWGGHRPGSGRPAGSDLARLDVGIRGDQMEWLDRLRAVNGDRTRAVTVRRMLDEARRGQGVREHLAALAAPEAGALVPPAQELARWVLAALDGKTDPEE